MGLQIARELARRGFGMTITSRGIADLQAVAEQLRGLGSPVVRVVAADMADPEGLDALVAAHRAEHHDMDALILNAGVGTAGPIADYPLHRLDKTMAVNFRAAFQLIASALPMLRASAARDPLRGARIIALASITGVHPEVGLAAYGASKAAVMSLIDTVNAEESGTGVTATALAPGYVDTDMSAWIHDEIAPEQMIPAEDIAVLVSALLQLSPRTVVGNIVLSRAGADATHA